MLSQLLRRCIRDHSRSSFISRNYCSTPSYIVEETHHLTSDCELPPLKDQLLRLYSMRWCPFAQRTRLSLAFKSIRHEVVNINLKKKPQWLIEKNPEGTVPVIELSKGDGQSEVVSGSLECCQWLDYEYPDTPALMDAYHTEKDKSSEVAGVIGEVSAAVNMFINDRMDNDAELIKALESANRLLSSSKYLMGNELSILDFLLWPWMERVLAKGFTLPNSTCLGLQQWVETMLSLQAVQDVMNAYEGYSWFWRSQKSGEYAYDPPKSNI